MGNGNWSDDDFKKLGERLGPNDPYPTDEERLARVLWLEERDAQWSRIARQDRSDRAKAILQQIADRERQVNETGYWTEPSDDEG